MSDHDLLTVRQEPDRVDRKRAWEVYVAAVIVTCVSIAIAGFLLKAQTGSVKSGSEEASGASGPRTIGVLDQTLFAEDDRGRRERAADESFLQTYGWVDREHGIARIPIERAMELVVEEDRPR